MPIPSGKAGMKKVMDEFQSGTLNSGSPSGPKVTNRKQAIAIGLNASGLSKFSRKKMYKGSHGKEVQK